MKNQRNEKGVRHGYWELQTMTVNYNNGNREGEYNSYWDIGKKSLFSRGSYSKGKDIGLWEFFNKDGRLFKKQFSL
jgi:hypothetical protein